MLFGKPKKKKDQEPEVDAEIPKPKLNAQFWYDLSATMVQGSIERLDANIDSISKLITTIYGFYTAANLLSLTYVNPTYVELIILAIPYILLFVAQWKSVVSSTVSTSDFSPDSDTSIRNAYQTVYNEKERQLNFLKKISFWAIASAGIALTSAFILSKQPVHEYSIAIRQVTDKNKRQLTVAGYVTNNDSSLYRIIIEQYRTTKNKDDSVKVLSDKTYLTTQSGEFQYSVPADTTGHYYTATLEWEQKGTRSIRQSTQKNKK